MFEKFILQILGALVNFIANLFGPIFQKLIGKAFPTLLSKADQEKRKLHYYLWGAPPHLPKFVGRKGIKKSLNRCWLESPVGVVSIIGLGGIGKSSLLRHLVDSLIDSQS